MINLLKVQNDKNMKTNCKILKKNVSMKKMLYFLILVLIIQLTMNSVCYCQDSDSLIAYPMPNGYFYPNKEIKRFISLISEGIQAKRKLSSEEKKTKILDSLLVGSYSLIDKQKNETTRLKIDSSFHNREVGLYKNFSEQMVKPFVKDLIIVTSKKERKTGAVIGFLFGVISTYLILKI